MPTLQVHVWAVNASVRVSLWAAETMGIWQYNGVFTTQWIHNTVRERVWEIAESVVIFNKQGAGFEQWDLLLDRCFTGFTDLHSERPLRK